MKHPKRVRVLAVAPSTRGLGFAVFEGPDTLVDWGTRVVAKDKNVGCATKIEKLMEHYHPAVLAIEDYEAEGSRRSPRIRELGNLLKEAAAARNVSVIAIPRATTLEFFLPYGARTRHDIAKILGSRFTEELGSSLPRMRRLWMSEDPRTDIFFAAAMALVYFHM